MYACAYAYAYYYSRVRGYIDYYILYYYPAPWQEESEKGSPNLNAYGILLLTVVFSMHNIHNRSIMEDIMYLEYVCNDGMIHSRGYIVPAHIAAQLFL